MAINIYIIYFVLTKNKNSFNTQEPCVKHYNFCLFFLLQSKILRSLFLDSFLNLISIKYKSMIMYQNIHQVLKIELNESIFKIKIQINQVSIANQRYNSNIFILPHSKLMYSMIQKDNQIYLNLSN
ncbi:hypothetical protein FGO68_gene13009 [Halteria grandinella]|uniref:Uncharacterized protein n=1 Tax=Halteria grandinella TaxID=5974 RepID=A0A8J8NAM1_HALGN|nr:hypothetical protein FGO68_gene13009 [Halteria grandinella]